MHAVWRLRWHHLPRPPLSRLTCPPSPRSEIPSGELPIVGYCAGPADAIQACEWTPGLRSSGGQAASGGDGKGGKKFKKGKADGQQQQQRFTIIF